jgi:hypothetical protein
MIGTEFCQVLLTILSETFDATQTLRTFHMMFPEKFKATFGSNGDAPLSDFFGDNIHSYTTKFANHCSIKFDSVFGYNGTSRISPKLYRLLTLLLGHPPTDSELTIEFNDDDFKRYYSKVAQIAKILREQEITTLLLKA